MDEARSGFFFHTMEKVVKKIVCTLPNANFARERVTRRDLIALARTNCNQRRDCDNICPAPYSNTYLHTYADQRMKMFLSKRFFNGFVWSFEKDVEKIFDLWNKLITIFIEFLSSMRREKFWKIFYFFSLNFKLLFTKYKHYWITGVSNILYKNYHIKSYINHDLTMKFKSSTYVTT